MTEVELAQATALSRCTFSPGSTEKRFVRWANENPKRTLTPKAAAFLDRLAHSYRKQLGFCMAKECDCTPKPPRVHRQGWDSQHRRRVPGTTLCGHPSHPHVERRIVTDEIFPLVPDRLRCLRCDRAKATAALHRTRLYADEWRIGFELLFISFARLATDMLELRLDPAWRHRCFHRCWCSGGSTCIEACGGCGSVSLLDVVTWSVAIAGWNPLCDGRDRVVEEDSEIGVDASGAASWSNWCRRCLRVVGEFHRPECPQPRITRSERKLVEACGFSSDYDVVGFVSSIRSPQAPELP